MVPVLAVDRPLVIGENPLWHPDEKKVYWLDIHAGSIFRYDPRTGDHEKAYSGSTVGGFTIQADGALLLFMENGSIRTWKDGALTTVIEEIPEERGTRFNDVIADPEGRVFCGTMPGKDHSARLYRLERDGTIARVVDGIGISNGMGFSPDLRLMYHTDSPRRVIHLFDYDRSSGALANKRVFVTVPEGEGDPDGMTVDGEGFVWSARWGGGCVVRYAPCGGKAPRGEEVLRVRLPAQKVSSLTFGGEEYRDLYITTAGGDKRPEEGEYAGALFRLTAGIGGSPEFRSRIMV